MDDTRISLGPASAATLAPMCTVIPRMSSPAKFDFPGVTTGAYLNPEISDAFDHRLRTADRSRRAVKGCDTPLLVVSIMVPRKLKSCLRICSLCSVKR